MFNFDYRSVICHSVIMGFILVMLVFTLFLSGCAVSGCGNPIIHNDVDSNDYINEQNTLTVNVPEHKLLQQKHRIKQERISRKYNRYS